MFTLIFWRETLERAVKTAAQTVATFFTLGALTPLPDLTITVLWQSALVGAAFSAITSLGSVSVTGSGSASLTPTAPAVVVVPPEATIVSVAPTTPPVTE